MILRLILFWLFALPFVHAQSPRFFKDVLSFPFGASVNPRMLDENMTYRERAGSEFNSLTAENHMKMVNVHPTADRFDFEKGDEIVRFAQNRQMRIHGHTLVWHNQVPMWMKDFQGDTKAWENMLKHHIQTVAGHYQGKVAGWDVVNESFLDDGTLRPSIWAEHIPDYIAKSFQWAHEADPKAILFYNDYGQDGKPKKMEAILAMVEDFKRRNIPIHGLGLQMHISVQSSNAAIEEVVRKSAATGLKIHFSELDVAVNPKNNPDFVYEDGAKDEQVSKYLCVFKAFQGIPVAQQYGITTWNIGDGDSWLRGYFKRPKEYPLLFDEAYRPKSTYRILMQSLKKYEK